MMAFLVSYYLQEMHDLSQLCENYNRHLLKVTKITVTDNFKFTGPRLVTVISNMLFF